MKWRTTTIEEFEQAIQEILQMVATSYSETNKEQSCIVCLQGDLGAGKTTATQIIAKHLGVEYNIQSPTFVIRKSYPTHDSIFKTLIHMDAYRLEGDQNLEVLRLNEDFKTPSALMIIEWPEMIKSIIPDSVIHIKIEHDNSGRIITLDNKKTA